MLVRLTLVLGLLLAPPVQVEPPVVPRDAFEPVPITVVEPVPAPTEPAPAEPVPPPIVIVSEHIDHVPVSGPPCMAQPRCRGMRISGVVVGTIGLAAVATGIGLVARKDRVIPDMPAFVTSTRPAGLVSLFIGVGVTLTAVLVLVASRSATRAAPRGAARLDGLGLRF